MSNPFRLLFQNRDGTLTDYMDIITASLNEMELASLADVKARGMIANAIAKSEIVLINKNRTRRRDEIYFGLNVRPNDNQTGTDFWFCVVDKLLRDGDALVIRTLDGKYFLAESYSTSSYVTFGKSYSNIVITDGMDSLRMAYSVSADNAIHLRYSTDKKRALLNKVIKAYNRASDAIQSMIQIASNPKFKFKAAANITFREKNPNGSAKNLMVDEYIRKLTNQLNESGISIIRETEGTSLEWLDIKSSVSVSDLKTMHEDINAIVAQAYDIPLGVFNGSISDQSDATNEFITYAVQPIAEIISDSLNAKIVGQSDYVSGEQAFVWLSHFKHIDVIDSADKLSALRGIGFTLDEIFGMVGYPELNTEFSTTRALTKNYAAEGSEEGLAADDPAEELSKNTQQKTISKHRERRERRNGKSEKVLSAGHE